MKKTDEQLFLEVKEKLDYHRLPTVFPYECVDLLSKILGLLDRQPPRSEGKENSPAQGSEINEALRLEISKIVKENNKLHMDLITAKEQVSALRHSNDKLLIERAGGAKEVGTVIQMYKAREEDLFEELTQVKYKYNELMDLVHEDSEVERKYIKRLMKHKKLDITDNQRVPQNQSPQKGPHQTVTDLEAKVVLLQSKLGNREAEIMRLQRKLEYDGLNMNKVLKDFQNSRTDSKIQVLEQQLEHLEEQNKKLKDEVTSCRNKGGSKQALREEVRKNHSTIEQLSQENKELKRKVKQVNFEYESKSREGGRTVKKSQNELAKVVSQLKAAEKTIQNLNKKVQFLGHQLQTAKVQIDKNHKLSVEKDVQIQQYKNADQGQKLLAHYELQSLKQKQEQYEVDISNLQEQLKELKVENDYHRKEDRLKNEAIDNLEKIVDELMKRNSRELDPLSSDSAVSIENTIALRKNLAETKQLLAICQNDKQRLERELQALAIRLQHRSSESSSLNVELSRLKTRLMELKNSEEQVSSLQKQISVLQSDLRKEQNFRLKIDEMHQEAEADKAKLRKELQEVTQELELYERKTKSQLNAQKMEINELEQNNQMLEIRLKEKEKKNILLEERVEELLGKVKILKDETSLMEQERNSAVRDKHKYEKRLEEMQKTGAQVRNEPGEQQQAHAEIISYQKQIERLRDRIAKQNERILQLESYGEAIRLSQDNLVQENYNLRKENEQLQGRNETIDYEA